MQLANEHYTAVLVDPDLRWLEAVELVLEQAGVEVIVRTTSVDHALAAIAEREPSLLVTETRVNGSPEDGIECVRQARKLVPSLKSVVLSSEADEARAAQALDAGALAYLVKPARPADLPAAVRRAFGGPIYLSRARASGEVGKTLPPRGGEPRLTRREPEILRLAMEGLTNGELARILWVTEPTVKFHLSNIYRKLGVANRAEATRWAREHGFAPLRHAS